MAVDGYFVLRHAARARCADSVVATAKQGGLAGAVGTGDRASGMPSAPASQGHDEGPSRAADHAPPSTQRLECLSLAGKVKMFVLDMSFL